MKKYSYSCDSLNCGVEGDEESDFEILFLPKDVSYVLISAMDKTSFLKYSKTELIETHLCKSCYFQLTKRFKEFNKNIPSYGIRENT